MTAQEQMKTEGMPGTQDELPPGTELLQGQYVIRDFLNAGGFGITYRAVDSLERPVVIKECFPGAFCRRSRTIVQARSRAHTAELESIVRLFVQEAKSLSKLQHPNIVGVHQVFSENDTAYMALDYIEGRDLLEILDEGPALEPARIVEIMRAMLDALGFVHQEGMLHRDISPDNILMKADGTPVLIDFGAARHQVQKQSRVLSALRVVKDGYSPQEFYVTGAEQGPFSDLYALGATFYHLISGELPPDSQSRLTAIATGSPDPYVPLVGNVQGYKTGVLASVDQAMSVLPADRWQNAGDWREAMDKRVRIRTRVVTRPAPIRPQVEVAPSRTGARLAAGVAVLAFAAAGAMTLHTPTRQALLEQLGVTGTSEPETTLTETGDASPVGAEAEGSVEVAAGAAEDATGDAEEVTRSVFASADPTAEDEGPQNEGSETVEAAAAPVEAPAIPEAPVPDAPAPTVLADVQILDPALAVETSIRPRLRPSEVIRGGEELVVLTAAPADETPAASEPEAAPAPPPPGFDDVASTAWTVRLPFGDLKVDARGSMVIRTVDGAAVEDMTGLRALLADRAADDDTRELTLEVGLGRPGGPVVLTQPMTVPVVQQTRVGGAAFQTVPAEGGGWRTQVVAAGEGATDLQPGDVLLATAEDGVPIDDRYAFSESIERALEQGRDNLPLQIRREDRNRLVVIDLVPAG